MSIAAMKHTVGTVFSFASGLLTKVVYIHLIQPPYLHSDDQIEPAVTNVRRQTVLQVDRQRHIVHV
jgi:hypothetical protein